MLANKSGTTASTARSEAMSVADDLPPTNLNPVKPTDGGEPEQRAILSLDQLQTMISESIQAILSALKNAIATKVTDSIPTGSRGPASIQ